MLEIIEAQDKLVLGEQGAERRELYLDLATERSQEVATNGLCQAIFIRALKRHNSVRFTAKVLTGFSNSVQQNWLTYVTCTEVNYTARVGRKVNKWVCYHTEELMSMLMMILH